MEARVKAAGLTPMPSESFVNHIHSHLDVFYNGSPVTVPGLVGIDPQGKFISALHTHDASGVLHIEAPDKKDITLGQFFTEWGVPLTGATAYVAGAKVADAQAVVLADRQEIAVVYGTAPATVPSSYASYP